MIPSPMEIDSKWRITTIGEAQGEGYTHLRATCPKCGRVPWPLLLGRKGTNRETFLGNIPLRCLAFFRRTLAAHVIRLPPRSMRRRPGA
jgi:hypothetical protein